MVLQMRKCTTLCLRLLLHICNETMYIQMPVTCIAYKKLMESLVSYGRTLYKRP